MDDDEFRYLEIAYEESDGSPLREVSSQQVGMKLGADDDRQREIERQLINQGLLEDAGSGFRLRLTAVHAVEEQRLESGQEDVVDERRQQRGDYVRELFDLADEQPGVSVPLSDIREELTFSDKVERRTREYLAAAGLVDVDDQNVSLTKQGAEWARGA